MEPTGRTASDASSISEIRARLSSLKDEIEALIAALPIVNGAPAQARFMKVKDFAVLRGFSDRTIRDYCDLGMPHVGEGKGRRIKVQEAIVWLESGGPRQARKRGQAA